MVERIYIVVDRAEKERYRRLAAREGKSLSEWLRAAAQTRAAATRDAAGLNTAEGLRDFFEEIDRRESGREPDWDEQKEVIARSKSRAI